MLTSPPQQGHLDLTPFSGHWVAIIRGQVYAVGDSAVQALRSAKFQRPKDDPEIIWVPLRDSNSNRQ